MKRQSIKANFIYNLIYQLASVFFPLITIPYLSRTLKPTGVGTYSYVQSIVSYYVLFASMGFSTYGQIGSAKIRENKVKLSSFFWEIICAKTVVSFCVLSIYALFVQFIAGYLLKPLYLIMMPLLIANYLDLTWFLQGIEEFKVIFFRRLIIKVVETAAIFIFVKDTNCVGVYLAILVISELLGNILLLPYILKNVNHFYWKSVNLKSLSNHIINSAVYFIPTIATSIYLTVDKSMLGWFVGTKAENGYYEQAQKLSQMASAVVTGVSVVMMPRMAFLFNDKKYTEFIGYLEKSIRFVLFLSIPMCMGIIGIADILITIFVGPEYGKSILLLKIFSVLVVIVGLNNIVGKQALMAIGKQKQYNNSVILGALVNVFFNLCLIPRFLSYGAAASSVMAELTVLALFLYYSQEYVNCFWIIKECKDYIFSASIMLLVIILVHNNIDVSMISLMSLIILGGFSYVIVLLLLKNEMIEYILKSVGSIFKGRK